jgi:hypothetical protein
VNDRGANHRPGRPDPNERTVGGDPMAPQRRHVPEGFQKVRLALTVTADQHAGTGLEVDGDARVVAEVDQF